MVVKVFISGISGNKEVKKRQQRVLMILDSRNVKYEAIDIAEPCNEEHKDFMQSKSTSFGGTIGDPNPKHPLPPQIFNDDEYCGDYDQFDLSNEIDEMEKFLKMAPDVSATAVSTAEVKLGNGEVKELKEENGTAEADQNEKPAEDKVEAETDVKEEANGAADNSKNEENEREKSPESKQKKEDDAEATKEEASENNGAGDEKAEVENNKEENGKVTDETKEEEKDDEAEEDEEEEE